LYCCRYQHKYQHDDAWLADKNKPAGFRQRARLCRSGLHNSPRPESNPALTRTPGGSIEDFATVVRDPKRLDEVLTATQVKDTRESGSVTFNSSDVLDAIRHLFTLQKANPKRVVKRTFLTTSDIGEERKDPLPSGRPGIAVWRGATGTVDIQELRAAHCARSRTGNSAPFFAPAPIQSAFLPVKCRYS